MMPSAALSHYVYNSVSQATFGPWRLLAKLELIICVYLWEIEKSHNFLAVSTKKCIFAAD